MFVYAEAQLGETCAGSALGSFHRGSILFLIKWHSVARGLAGTQLLGKPKNAGLHLATNSQRLRRVRPLLSSPLLSSPPLSSSPALLRILIACCCCSGPEPVFVCVHARVCQIGKGPLSHTGVTPSSHTSFFYLILLRFRPPFSKESRLG